ncbi:transcription antitermination factor NusB [Georgenia subflava]|uniref:Transcription antitermination protein NusB n=1 Tax=Georgenia subflava TaxID=1622177 RepID=A0A6N7ES37_9MICO|nr:transcription antitermination factor NusB [Georgenia subflava]MPV37994.1 transcription antitermination factor NusB [Georgenia subflava]
MAARTKARRRALDVLFEADQKGKDSADELLELLEQRMHVTVAQGSFPQYAVDIVEGVAAHRAELDELLSTYSQGWSLDRMPTVDRCILRLGAWELLHNDDVPDAVAVDEAVHLAAELSTDDSPGFVNGLLARLLELKPTL